MTTWTDVPVRTGQTLGSVVDPTRVLVLKTGSATKPPASGGAPLRPVRPRPCSLAAGSPATGPGPRPGRRYTDVVTGLEVLCTAGGHAALTYDGRDMTAVSHLAPGLAPGHIGE
jgi:hypothetical protein